MLIFIDYIHNRCIL